jgi:hypothetical protein
MAKKWAIDDGPPLKMRLVKEIECSKDAEPIDKPIRVRTIGKRIIKAIVTLWILSVGAWLQACYGSGHTTNNADEPHDAIDGHSDPFNAI